MIPQKQMSILKKIGINYDGSSKLSAEQKIEIEEKAGDYLTLYCLNEDYSLTKEGRICEQLLNDLDKL